ncbi:MAG TPA: glutamine-hydrolyzing GMP synthase [Candidatus Ignatzschineria merdigallinarum]|uniref:GMP synthase [glutamine-hydrolyzing] n=1 Tax=Candidatus Ignatzschineria merdigallinarum TaxID=2838621 RepID=A0A9D1Q5G3_9GAMM|nr:glutamine-hydrolyzing GMP synthase [Candidatus Ignatzschineria merdigallinarum]
MAQHLDNKILIVHVNQQDAQKIARLLRDAEYYSEITTIKDLATALDQFPPKAILSNTLAEIETVLSAAGKNIPVFNLDETSDRDAVISFVSAQGIQPVWNVEAFIEHHTIAIQNTVQNDEVILGLSGGVDSSVVAALIHKAIGKQLTCVFVDTGLLRLNEGDKVMQAFAENMGINIIRVDAEERYLEALKGVNDPEKKRKIIGELFVRIFEEESRKLPSAKWLAQGTIYPDILESLNTKDGVAVKSHHNVGGLPEDMELKLLEPISSLFKHEVRELGVALGLPRAMVYRHPFPGPGLGVRILGEIKKEYADILRLADDIFIEELIKADLYDKTSQAFAVFVPVKSVGVQDDKRVYAHVIALRAIETIDFMTARAAHLPWDFIEHVSTRIIKEVEGVSRVTYDVSNKPPATIEWE